MTLPKLWTPIVAHDGNGHPYGNMEECSDGDYVEFKDYDELRQQYLKLRGEVLMFCDEASAKLRTLSTKS